MKKAGILTLCGLVVAVLVGFAGTANARPDFPKVVEKVKGLEPIKDAAKDAKCNLCHYGKSKKNRNDFGKALAKGGLTKDIYNDARKDKDTEEKLAAVAKLLNEHLDKLLKSEDGAAFKKRIADGELPADNPEE